ncbi:MAG: DNA alkylation repair protein [Oliverpabstia sp.]
MIAKIREKLSENADLQYKNFHQSLVPGLESMIGVRIPKLREIAKWASKQNWQPIWGELSEECYEELMIKGMLIGYSNITQKEQTEYLKRFIPLINNWAICDCCCSTWKFMKKDQDYWFSFLKPYLSSIDEFQVRFAVVALLDYFVEEKYLHKIFSFFDHIQQHDYYVQMAVAWAVSVCFVKYPGETKLYLCSNHLDDFTQNKAIQKIRESNRVSRELKEEVLTWKRI